MAKNRRNRHIAIVAVILLILVLAGILLAYNHRGSLQTQTEVKGDTIHQFESGKGSQFAPMGDRVVVVDTDGITFAQRGKTVAPQTLAQMAAPQLRTNGNYTLVYDREGTAAQAFEGDSLCASITSDQPILTAKVNASGYMVFVTSDTGYKAKITVYSKNGKALYQWRLGEEYVLDADISPNGQYLAASTLNIGGVAAQSTVRLVSIADEQVLGETARGNSLLFTVKFIDDRTVAVLGDDIVLAFDQEGQQLWEHGFDGRALQTAVLQENNNLVLAFGGTNNNTEVEIYDTKGQLKGAYTSESEIKSISVYKGDIAVAQGRQVIILSHKGAVKASAAMDKDIQQIMMLPSGRVAVVGGNAVDIIKP